MSVAEIYVTSRQRLLDLAATLTPTQTEAALVATPPWTVTDGYRHLAGACADVLDGNMAEAPSPAWTAAQLAARADRSLAEVAAEWAERGPQLDAVLRGNGVSHSFIALDVWTHAQDIRAAVGVGGERGDDLLGDLVDLTLGATERWYIGKGGPALRIVLPEGDRTLGKGDPEATLATDAYELLRIVFGRRSAAQIAAADWSGDAADAARAAIHIFDPPPVDIAD